MSKDSYWFRHDSTAGRGTRMRKMAFIYSHWGKGVYWDVIEMLRDQENYKFPCSDFDLKMLADLIGCKDETKFINWFNDCVKFGLFKVEGEEFFSEILCENMKRWETSKENGKKGGRPPKQKPKKNLNDNPTNNLNETIIEEDSIEDKSIIESFELFWDLYDRKVGDKNKLLEKWKRLTEEEIKSILNHVPKYVKSTPDKQFRKHPTTYINNKSWNDEILNLEDLPPIQKLVANVALQVPAELKRLLDKGYTKEQIEGYAS